MSLKKYAVPLGILLVVILIASYFYFHNKSKMKKEKGSKKAGTKKSDPPGSKAADHGMNQDDTENTGGGNNIPAMLRPIPLIDPEYKAGMDAGLLPDPSAPGASANQTQSILNLVLPTN